ncbi:MAG: energy-coupling factor ABC transporter ATP-binding protein [Candidatus Actinomarina sp.]|jgi:energy-coupling factor transporter ATP-binding protein EcfA2|nr:energy-coupling factor ABC transporter ATP-binding protein [Actinomycetota bacterium]MDA7547651.1 energy-coupling factor ABC transporter ATP-binding protein [Acidimicrobiia bacterium]MDA9608251.1 energy-coupling factor ABC transporter ATP-binding protein [Candidatus Actinomarina sp.]MDB2628034.1 energy-coupling factor ABC transporter ATP-binding protein [Candidatus Actinomarina sp.]MDB4814420.1 energy-coupling factor ABC transporter ATP-binding protein [Acidimicrobiia bacterium]|tara:strand:+ start:1485 stop:2315 length:831 start_codon:yes stop_codon:yes gene_type:complete
MSIIKIEDLTVQYLEQEENALDKISLEVEEGEFVAILGAHGAGKTTLCLSINGIVPNMINADMFGKIEVAGEIPPNIPVRELASKVGSVFDNPEFQMSQLTVFEEVALGLQNLGVDKDTIIENITTSLELVGLAGFEERSPFEISGGQQQRLAMASALSMKPQILVLDEPTSNLDPIGKEEVFTVTRKINQEEGLTVIIAEHEVEVIAEYADKVILLEQGKITQVGTPEELFPNIVDIQSNVGVRIPQITDFASRVPDKFTGSIPVTVDKAIERYN